MEPKDTAYYMEHSLYDQSIFDSFTMQTIDQYSYDISSALELEGLHLITIGSNLFLLIGVDSPYFVYSALVTKRFKKKENTEIFEPLWIYEALQTKKGNLLIEYIHSTQFKSRYARIKIKDDSQEQIKKLKTLFILSTPFLNNFSSWTFKEKNLTLFKADKTLNVLIKYFYACNFLTRYKVSYKQSLQHRKLLLQRQAKRYKIAIGSLGTAFDRFGQRSLSSLCNQLASVQKYDLNNIINEIIGETEVIEPEEFLSQLSQKAFITLGTLRDNLRVLDDETKELVTRVTSTKIEVLRKIAISMSVEDKYSLEHVIKTILQKKTINVREFIEKISTKTGLEPGSFDQCYELLPEDLQTKIEEVTGHSIDFVEKMTRYSKIIKKIEPILYDLLRSDPKPTENQILQVMLDKTGLAPMTIGPCFYFLNNEIQAMLPCQAGRLEKMARKIKIN